ncbi:Triosephosphate isomerase (EC [Olavius algarvensis associated proteobacterium Delta 3]|nr:Triosephosphate isomerase (EC [Olavius algarvensis associated proteobacterium Delta 3]CAB5119526.1 Triosephosphate isomerase (EC [Olavius algarvensis associated proteobacterium Delta 3]
MGNRTPLIAGNWKMYKTCPEAVNAAERLAGLIPGGLNVDVMIAPAYTALFPVADVLRGSIVALGAQNLYWETEGAYTGEVSAAMIQSAGCSHVIIGHSERRQFFGETDENVNRKIRAAVDARLVPVLCIGETEAERDAGETFAVLDKQVQMGLESFSLTDLERLVVAYEPVWAIGTGKTATSVQAQEAHRYVRGLVEKTFGDEFAAGLRILYGGSVKPSNVRELMDQPDVDGALVGGASLDPDTFIQIVTYQNKIV